MHYRDNCRLECVSFLVCFPKFNVNPLAFTFCMPTKWNLFTVQYDAVEHCFLLSTCTDWRIVRPSTKRQKKSGVIDRKYSDCAFCMRLPNYLWRFKSILQWWKVPKNFLKNRKWNKSRQWNWNGYRSNTAWTGELGYPWYDNMQLEP